MLWAASTGLYAVYFLLPLASLVFGWTGNARLRRSITGAWVSGSLLAALVLAAFAVGMGGSVSMGQVAIALYFGVGLLLFLRLVDGLVVAGLWRLLGAERGKLRFLLASVLRLVVFGGFTLPWVMAVLMVNRPRVVIGDDLITAEFPHDSVVFPAADGVPIHGLYFPVADGRTVALLCHGLGGNTIGFTRMIERLHAADINVLAIDLRAHGGSGGQRCSYGVREKNDVVGAAAFLKQHYGPAADRIVGVGASLGAAALLGGAAEDKSIDGVVVLSTYTSVADELDAVARQHFVWPLGWLVRHFGLAMSSLHSGVDLRLARPVDDVAELWPRPVLIVHGTADEIIPFEQGRRLYDAAPFGRQSDWVFNGSHNGLLDDAGVIDRVIAFILSARPQPVV